MFPIKSYGQLVAIVLITALSACSNGSKEVSGPSYCKEYNEKNLTNLASQATLQSARSLRDLYMECDLTNEHFDDAKKWRKIAAELGDAEDKRAYNGLVGSDKPSVP